MTKPFQSSRHAALQSPAAVPMQFDVRIWREADGRLCANIPHSVIWHSPDGYDCGYGGSGSADLALNVLNAFVPPGPPLTEEDESERLDEPVKCYRGVCSRCAARYHQDFKWQFIASMDPTGGRIEASTIQAWIAERMRPQQSESPSTQDPIVQVQS